MPAIPTRRLLVYVAAGLVVLVVGTLGLVFMRAGADSAGEELVIEAGGSASAEASSATGIASGAVASARPVPGPDDETAVSSSTTGITQTHLIYVQVAGAVRDPGVHRVAADARVFQAIRQAGGFTDDADEQAVALAAGLSDGCRIYVPRKGESVSEQVQVPAQSSAGISGGSTSGTSGSGAGSAGAASAGGPVSINSATAAELDTLPGIGPSLAQQIISYRESQGPFTSVEQLTDVPGIGPAKFEQLRPLVGL